MRAKTKAVVLTKSDQQARISDATRGLIKSYPTRLGELSPKYVSVICDYISALRSEIKLSNGYRQNILNTLIALSRVSKNKKEFKDFTRADVITFMKQFRKEDSEDPTHRWIGTYNTNLVNVSKFFKWLYLSVEPAKRSKPEVIQNFPKLRRLEISGYEPSDMWDAEDNRIFLKYCPNSRDRCYHAMETDVGARPNELLNLRIKDVKSRRR
jgi:integrase/recombinase XerD